MNKLLIPALLCLPSICSGSAFQHFQQSAASIGYAHADMAALADEPATAYYNPAGMGRLPCNGIQIGFSNTTINTQFEGSLKITDSTNEAIFPAVFGVLGFPARERIGDNLTINLARGDTTPILGYFHGVLKIPEIMNWQRNVEISLGLSATSPWAFETNYRCSKVYAYTQETIFQSFALTPSISARFCETLSVGVGASWQQLKFDSCSTIMGSAADLKLDDWRWTFNVGLLYEINSLTRIGATYKPKINHRMDGRLRLASDSGESHSTFSLPQSFTLGIYRQVTCCFDLMATVVYTNWNQFKPISIRTEIEPVSANTNGSGFYIFDGSEINYPVQLQDTFMISVGARYWVDKWQIRGGLGYDSNPIKKHASEFILPDNERYIASFGLGYHFDNHLSFDFGYQFLYLPKSQINAPFLPLKADFNSEELFDEPLQVNDINQKALYAGSTRSWAQVVSAQIRWDF